MSRENMARTGLRMKDLEGGGECHAGWGLGGGGDGENMGRD